VEFTYEAYSRFLRELKAAGYRLTSFLREETGCSRQVILRHDVDIAPEKAVQMAKLELDYGVNSTYFFMLSSEFYNLMDQDNEEALLEIRGMGHEIGLHFDIAKYLIHNEAELERQLMKELNVLGELLSMPIKAVSWHIPDKRYYNRALQFLRDRWIKNAYDPEFVSQYKYLSDSNMRWRENPLECIDPDRFPKLQILTHPVWYWEEERGKREILNVELGMKAISTVRYLEVISPGFAVLDPNHV